MIRQGSDGSGHNLDALAVVSHEGLSKVHESSTKVLTSRIKGLVYLDANTSL